MANERLVIIYKSIQQTIGQLWIKVNQQIIRESNISENINGIASD
jgi:hypothetical protein